MNEPYLYVFRLHTHFARAHKENHTEHIYTQIAFSWHFFIIFYVNCESFCILFSFSIHFSVEYYDWIPFVLIFAPFFFYFCCFVFCLLWNSRIFVLTPNIYYYINCTIVAYKHKILWSARTLNYYTKTISSKNTTSNVFNISNLRRSPLFQSLFILNTKKISTQIFIIFFQTQYIDSCFTIQCICLRKKFFYTLSLFLYTIFLYTHNNPFFIQCFGRCILQKWNAKN